MKTKKGNLIFHFFALNFDKEENRQDVVESLLLLAFVSLAAMAVLGTIHTNLSSVWMTVSMKLSAAAKTATD